MNLLRKFASRGIRRQNDRLKEEIEDACNELAAYDEEVNKLQAERKEYRSVLATLKEGWVHDKDKEMIEIVLEKYKTD